MTKHSSLGKPNFKVDHRCGSRMLIRTTVQLYQHGEHVGNAIVSNLSPNGLFIEKSSLNLNKHNMLEVEFKASTNSDSTHYRIPAMVVYCSANGYGLDLDLDTAFPEARLAILLLMNKAKRQQTIGKSTDIAA